MFRFRKVAALLLFLVLVTPWCAAAARPGSHGQTAFRASAGPLEALQAGIWSWLRVLWAKEGCTIDPSGKPACGPTDAGEPDPAAPTSNSDIGCGIDPGGSPCGGHQ